MTIRIVLPYLSTSKPHELEPIYQLVQSTPELGFAYKSNLKDHIKENEERGTLWAAFIDDDFAGTAMMGSRGIYHHLARHGEIVVKEEFRRKRIGTALYTAHVLQAILEGRREMEDTIILSLSPWMAGPTECGMGFLPSLKYRHIGTFPERTSGFRDMAFFVKQVIEIRDHLDRLPASVSIEIRSSEKVEQSFARNIENYEKHKPELAVKMRKLKDIVERLPFVQIAAKE